MSDTTPRITLGDRVRDPITGFEGIAICRMDWLYGCVRYCVQKEELDDKHKVIEMTFDEAGLTVTEAGVRSPHGFNEERTPGGPDRNDQAMLQR